MSGNLRASASNSAQVGAAVFAAASLAAAALINDPMAIRIGALLVGFLAIGWLGWPTSSPVPEPVLEKPSSVETAPVIPSPAIEPAVVETSSDEPFRRLFETGPISLALLNPSGDLREYSSAFGSLIDSKQTLIGMTFVEMFEEKDREDLAAAIQAAVLDDGMRTPVIARLAGGRKETCSVVFSAIQEAPTVIAASVQDVSQENLINRMKNARGLKLEAQFAQSQKMLAVGQLAGGVAHDFNNLLTANIGHADLLMLHISPSDESFADINQIKQNSNRAANLVRQLLAFSRQQTLQPRVLDVGEALSDLGNLLRRLLGAGVSLNIRHGRDVALVKVDRVQLEQVVMNLAVNARDAMDGRGELDISTRMKTVGDTTGTPLEPMPAGDYVLIDVADKGAGIDPEHLARIFEPFFTTKPLGEGTGLGLSTVYGIVKQTGGFVFVDSAIGE
ncbi:MAG: PAS domain-containing sensor histidine kinase [Alphaproteobacteria bacterium]